MKKFKMTQTDGKIPWVLGLERINIVKINVLLRPIYIIQCNLCIKIPNFYFTELKQIILKFVYKQKRSPIVKIIMR